MSLEDLRVAERTQGKGWGTSTSYRNAIREDVLAAVREWEGVEKVWWCETHERVSGKAWVDGDAKVRVCDLCDQYGNLGRVVPALIVPLDTGDTE